MSFVDPPQVPIPTTGVPGVGLSPQLTGSTNPHTEVSFDCPGFHSVVQGLKNCPASVLLGVKNT